MNDAAPSSWRGHPHSSRHIAVFVVRPSAGLRTALSALDEFERAILEHDDRGSSRRGG
ncbi:hypothetical protein ACVOMV_30885 [Mesorhizobium atlanticum]